MNEWLDQWFAAKRDVNQRTRDSYESVVRLHLRPHLGTVQLDKLTSAHVAAMFDAIEARNADPRLRDSDPRDVRSRKCKVTLPTQYKIRKVLAMVLRDAIEHRLIDRMPAGWGNLLPSPPRRSPTVWTPEQVNRFLEATHDDRLYALWWLALLRGPRRSELLAMRWADVKWQAREIDIPGSKTEAGIRSIPLSEEGVGILRAHRKRTATRSSETCGPAPLRGGLRISPSAALTRDRSDRRSHRSLVTARGLGPPLKRRPRGWRRSDLPVATRH
jgi:integrase